MRRTLVILGLLAAAAACGGSSGGPGLTVVSGGLAYFLVTGQGGLHTISALPGAKVQLTGSAYDGNLRSLVVKGDTTWTSRDTTLAKVNSTGLVTMIATGSTYVIGTITVNSVTVGDSALVRVLSPQ
ncbi:MAG: Ig-like domain-containing protein [Gemmatimonadaceae bacterium]